MFFGRQHKRLQEEREQHIRIKVIKCNFCGNVYSVTVFPKVLTVFLKEDIFRYKEDTDSLEVKLLNLKKIDFHLTQTGKLLNKSSHIVTVSRETTEDCTNAISVNPTS